MAATLSTVAIDDGDGNPIAGDVRAIDESGAGTGPFRTSLSLIDGASVANALAVSAAGSAKVEGPGTAGTAAGGVLSVQGVASMTPVQVSQATAANLNATVLGTGSAGTAATGVVTIQGIASMTAVQTTTTSAVGTAGAAVPATASYDAGLAATALPTAESSGDLVGNMVDKFGRQVMLVSTLRDLVGTQTTTISNSTSETTIVTAAASVFNDLVMLIISNTSASSNTRIDFRDDTAGTVLFSLQSNGGQPPVGFALPTPIPQTAVNKNWTAQCASAVTDVRIYAVFAKNK